jgi:hypothetical protein
MNLKKKIIKTINKFKRNKKSKDFQKKNKN